MPAQLKIAVPSYLYYKHGRFLKEKTLLKKKIQIREKRFTYSPVLFIEI